MGRPLKQKFFDPVEGSISIGGEAVSTLSFSNRGGGYYSANVAITLGAPNLPTGTQATVGTIALFGNGAINTFTVAGGTGYTTAPSVTITGANTTPAVATSTLVSNAVTNVIATSAFIPAANGGSSAWGTQMGDARLNTLTFMSSEPLPPAPVDADNYTEIKLVVTPVEGV
jgi:hypothetical protein